MSAKKTDIFYPDRIVDGKFVTRPVLDLMRDLNDCQIEVCIRPFRPRTSLKQHRYYRRMVIELLVETMRGHGVTGPHGGPITHEQVHQMMAQRFLRESVLLDEETGEYMDIVKSTADLTTGEMVSFVEAVRDWAYETFGLDIPDPDPDHGVRVASP